MSTECYWCARRLDLGHHGGCPALEMQAHKLSTFLGHALAVRHAQTRPEPATPLEAEDTLPVVVRGKLRDVGPIDPHRYGGFLRGGDLV